MLPARRIEEFDRGATTELIIGVTIAGVFGSLAVYTVIVSAPLPAILFMFMASQGFRYLGRTCAVSTCGAVLAIISIFLGVMYSIMFM